MVHRAFSAAAAAVSHIAGRPWVFVMAALVVLLWLVAGPIFDYSDTWQLWANTGTTIVTFLMLFLLQNSQNRDGAATHAKLDNIIQSLPKANNAFIRIEDLTEDEIQERRQTSGARPTDGKKVR